MEKVKKQLVFYFYICENWKDDKVIQLHFNCLEHYNHVFDEATFYLSTDSADDDTIREVEQKILSLKLTPNISFKIVKNTYLREAKIFYEEIACKLNDYDGLVFFGHTKGITNTSYYGEDITFKWVTSLYYGSLEYANEAEKALTEGYWVSFGPLLVKSEPMGAFSTVLTGKGNYQYMGTFFWLNPRRLYEYLNKKDRNIGKIADRWYAENFLANVADFDAITSHNYQYVMNEYRGGNAIDDLIKFTLGDDLENYHAFYNKMINE